MNKERYIMLMKISSYIYILVLLFILFGMNRGVWANMSMMEYALFQMNIIPFKTIGEYIGAICSGSMNLYIPLTNLFGNLFMFFPMGFYLPAWFSKIDTWKRYLASIAVILLLLELLQFVSKRGAFDIDDLILNMLGALAGFYVWKSYIEEIFLSKWKDRRR